ncbi:MAG: porin [Bacteroidaceae bacterium]|nr:porin [Bacteroidaceae bacterium]
MRQLIIAALAATATVMPLAAATLDVLPEEGTATDDTRPNLNMDNGVVPIADNRGFTLQSKDGRFVFKPYLMLQTSGNFNWYDDEGLDKAYNQDNVANSGFAIPNAIIGFTGRAFGRIDYNVSVNAAASGHAILQQAWIDYGISPAAHFRVGKFKTPFTHAYLTTLGETLMPAMPNSLTQQVILPYSLNAVTPSFATGFDLGVQFHGMAKCGLGYDVGIFNGTGINTNMATKTISDDLHIPSLLYAGRLTYQPWGKMPTTQGNPRLQDEKKLLVGIAANYNVESENESTNDLRLGAEVAFMWKRLYLAGEFYYMNVAFTKRQKITDTYHYLGGYVQAGYFVTRYLQPALRYDFYDRNGVGRTGAPGFLNAPAVALNYFIPKCNLKLSAMYEFVGRWGHDTQVDRDMDDLGVSTHRAVVMLQYSF